MDFDLDYLSDEKTRGDLQKILENRQKFQEAVESNSEAWLRSMGLTLLWTGASLSEIIELKVGDLLPDGYINFDNIKVSVKRKVLILDQDIFKKISEVHSERNPEEYLFQKTGRSSKKHFENQITELRNKANIKFPPKDIRFSYGAYMAYSGFPVTLIRIQMGYRSTRGIDNFQKFLNKEKLHQRLLESQGFVQEIERLNKELEESKTANKLLMGLKISSKSFDKIVEDGVSRLQEIEEKKNEIKTLEKEYAESLEEALVSAKKWNVASKNLKVISEKELTLIKESKAAQKAVEISQENHVRSYRKMAVSLKLCNQYLVEENKKLITENKTFKKKFKIKDDNVNELDELIGSPTTKADTNQGDVTKGA